MKTEWIKGLNDPKEIEKMQQSVKSSKLILDKVAEICYNRVRELENVTLHDYSDPAWAAKQAHTNGMKEAYRKVIEIVTIKD